MLSTRDIVHIALFAAITAVLGLMPPVPLAIIPAPVTAQTLGVMLSGAILGARRGALAQLLFVALVAVGLPVLAGGRGGIGIFAGPTGGFLAAWPMAAAVTGLIVERYWRRLGYVHALAACLIGGVAVVYAVGVPWLSVAATLPLRQAAAGALVFLPGDIIKAAIAAGVAVTVRRAYPLITVR